MSGGLTGLLAALGPVGVFLLMIPESALLPIPSELTLMFGGYLVHAGAMPYPLAVAAGTAGNLIGSLVAYGAGRSRLLATVERGPAAAALRRCDALFERHGERAVFIARLLPLARTFVSLPAGRAGVPLGRFVVLTTAGCALWSAAFVAIGLAAGSSWAAASSVASRVLLGAIAAAALVAWLRREHG